jgi:hypothetical protein
MATLLLEFVFKFAMYTTALPLFDVSLENSMADIFGKLV